MFVERKNTTKSLLDEGIAKKKAQKLLPKTHNTFLRADQDREKGMQLGKFSQKE